MATKQAENRAGLTATRETGLTPRVGTEVTPGSGTEVTAPSRTRRRYKARPRKCACGCGRMVMPTPQAPHKRYFDDACRKRAARRRAAKQRPSVPKTEPVLALTTCQFCGATFLAEVGKGTKWCKPAHKTAAAECRRAAAIEAVQAITGTVGGITMDDVKNFVEREGMKQVTRYLKQQGWLYDEAGRAWVMAVQVGDIFATVKG